MLPFTMANHKARTRLFAVISHLFLSLVLLKCSNALSAEKIIMGYIHLKPFQYQSSVDKRAKGAGIAYFERIAEEMGYEVEWVGPLPLPRLLEYIRKGENTTSRPLDGTAMIFDTPKWRQIYHLSEQPYYQVQSSLFVHKDSPLTKIQSGDDIKGLTIGSHCGAPPTQFIQNNKHLFKSDCLAGSKRMERSIQKLLMGRVDAYYGLNDVDLHYYASQMGVADQIRTLHLPEAPREIYVGFSKQSPKAKKLIQQYNQAADKLQLDFQRFLTREFTEITASK
ncbi:substrate-binding periplasmic protein [Agaribacterium sp. ZY112]|uniref:substrate-binding periplasmic protein n=1 Tax=Agaribacterium sp. ZY112 TaxID=3233574 RepID=UPI003524E810